MDEAFFLKKSLTILIITFLFCTIFSLTSFSERSDIHMCQSDEGNNSCFPAFEEWNITVGGSPPDGFSSVKQTSNQGYIATGYTYSYSQGKEDVWLFKTDSKGNEEWNTSFGTNRHDEGLCIVETADGGYVLVGKKYSSETLSYDAWIIKTDQNGTKQWDKTFGGSGTEIAEKIQHTNDSGFIVYGYSKEDDTSTCFLIKLNKTGIIQWNTSFGHEFNYSMMNGFSIVQGVDNGYFLTGQVHSEKTGSDGFLIKTDSKGKLLWMKSFGGSKTDYFRSVDITSTGIILTGTTSSFGLGAFDIWMLKTNKSGVEQWNTTFGGVSYDEGFDIHSLSDEGFVITGYTYSSEKDKSDVIVIKSDCFGNEEWIKTFGEKTIDKGMSIQETKDEDLIVAGSVNGDGWLIKIVIPSEINLRYSIIIGKIKDVTTYHQNFTRFISDDILLLYLSPLKCRISSQETIIISNDYQGIFVSDIIIGLFQSACVQ